MIANAADLLGIARDALLNEVLAACPIEHRYTVRMIANAMAIAEREINAAPHGDTLEAALLACMPDLLPPLAAEDMRSLLRTLPVEQVRSAVLIQAFAVRVQQQLVVSNPKKLNAAMLASF